MTRWLHGVGQVLIAYDPNAAGNPKVIFSNPVTSRQVTRGRRAEPSLGTKFFGRRGMTDLFTSQKVYLLFHYKSMHPLTFSQTSRKPHLGEQTCDKLHYPTYNALTHHKHQPIIPANLDTVSKPGRTYEPK